MSDFCKTVTIGTYCIQENGIVRNDSTGGIIGRLSDLNRGTKPAEQFEKELGSLINFHCEENASNTPDFILAQYMKGCLDIFNTAVQQREGWYGRDPRPTEQIEADPDTGEQDVPTVEPGKNTEQT